MLTVFDSSRPTELEHGRARRFVLDDVTDLRAGRRTSVSARRAGRAGRWPARCPSTHPSCSSSRSNAPVRLGIHGAGFAKVAADGTFSMRSGAGMMAVRIVGTAAAMVREIGAAGWCGRHRRGVRSGAWRRRRLDITLTDRVSRLVGDGDRSLGSTRVERARGHLSRGPRAMERLEQRRALSGRRSRTSRVATRSMRFRCRSYRVVAVTSLPRERVDGSRGARPSLAVGIGRVARRARAGHAALESGATARGFDSVSDLDS